LSEINLLYVIEGGQPGGAEQNLLTVVKTIDKTQYNITVCLLKPSNILEAWFKDSGIKFFVLKISSGWDIFSIFRLAGFIRRKNIDIVHTCLYASNTFGRIAAAIARAPVIIAWEQGEILQQTSARHYNIDRILAKFTDSIIACSNAVKEALVKKEGISIDKIRVVHNCVDLTKFNASSGVLLTRKRLGLAEDDILIGTAASLNNEVKGQAYLIKAMPQIIKAYPKTKLLLAGEGRSKSDFIKLIEELNIKNNVVLAGFRLDMPSIMAILDIYVCPSIYEGLGISIIEAMSLKKPVVATHVGGISEVVVENQTGYLVRQKDAGSIAQAVISLLADPRLMRQMGEQGFKRAKEYFSAELVTKKMQALYKEVSGLNT